MIGIYDIQRIYSTNASLTVSRGNNDRDTRCGFSTMENVQEWDEIIIETDYETRIFGGILDSPSIDFTDNLQVNSVRSDGYRKLFDRAKVQVAYENELAGDIVRDLVETYAPGFSIAGIEDGPLITKLVFNYVSLGEAIDRIANATGYRRYIDQNKVVYFVANDSENAPEAITNTGDFWKNLNINIDISGLVNVVIVRGGTYLSEEVPYNEIADGVKSQFVLPEKPHDVSVYVNGVLKTSGIKFGEEAPTTEFQINFNEKYIENGTHALLSDGDEIEVLYKYDVPIRIRAKNQGSIDAMKVLFPETDGEFIKVIQDKTIDTRELAYDIATQNLVKFGTRMIEGSFSTIEDLFLPGQVITITKGNFTGSALIQTIHSRQIAGSHWQHTVKFATVVFGFEEFMRDLYAAKKVELIDGETLETSHDIAETVSISEDITASTDLHRQPEGIEVEDESYSDLNVTIEYVLAPYFPSSFADTKRVFILDASPLA